MPYATDPNWAKNWFRTFTLAEQITIPAGEDARDYSERVLFAPIPSECFIRGLRVHLDATNLLEDYETAYSVLGLTLVNSGLVLLGSPLFDAHTDFHPYYISARPDFEIRLDADAAFKTERDITVKVIVDGLVGVV